MSKGIATLAYTSRGRAGWRVKVSGHADEAAHFGRRAVPELTAQDWAAIAEGTLLQVLADLFDEARAVSFGRSADDIKILPSASFVLGDTEAEAWEKHHEVRNQQVAGQTALILLEQIWNRDLSAFDPDGPVPDIEPDPDAPPIIQGRAFTYQDRFDTVATLRAVSEAKKLTLRETVVDQFERGPIVGTAAQVAEKIDAFVQNDGSDGFIIGSHLLPSGPDEFVDHVVPLLQDRGALRTAVHGNHVARQPRPAGAARSNRLPRPGVERKVSITG